MEKPGLRPAVSPWKMQVALQRRRSPCQQTLANSCALTQIRYFRSMKFLKWSDLKYVIWHERGSICRGKRYKPEEIVAKLRQVDVLVLAGAKLGRLGVTWSTGSIARKASAARLVDKIRHCESRMGFPSDLPNAVVSFQAAISRFVAEANDDPKPFAWLADPNKNIVAVRRGYQVLELI